MPHYIVAYGHTTRYEQAKDEAEAMKLAYGIIDTERMTLVKTRGMPRNLAKKALYELQRKLAKRHFARTGSILSGWEKEPGIANVHHTECLLCLKPIHTEPASKGVDETLCQECQPKYDALTPEQQEHWSTATTRINLGIKRHQSPCCKEK